jgi:hypothetical protein
MYLVCCVINSETVKVEEIKQVWSLRLNIRGFIICRLNWEQIFIGRGGICF